MSRINCLQQKYELAKSNFQSGDAMISVTPCFWSIYDNGRIRESTLPSQAVADSPKYIISAFVHHYTYYGHRKDAKIICYQNLGECEQYFSSIPLSTWSLSNIKIFGCELIEGATFELKSNYTQQFTFYFDSATPFRTMQMLWDFSLELDANCSTAKEAELYYKYYIAKLGFEE